MGGGGWSSAGGTALRYNLVDAQGHWASFDFPLHDAGDFDAITNLWVHVVLVTGAQSLRTYDDGLPVSDSLYGFYTGGNYQTSSNLAHPHPQNLSATMGSYSLTQPVILGSRADLDGER